MKIKFNNPFKPDKAEWDSLWHWRNFIWRRKDNSVIYIFGIKIINTGNLNKCIK